MKLQIRFGSFFTLGLFVFILYIGFVMSLLFGLILPLCGIGDDNFLAFLLVFIFSFTSGGLLFSLFFVQPLLFILSCTKKLSQGERDLSSLTSYIFTKKGTIKIRFFLYREAIESLQQLSNDLNETELERKHLNEAKQSWVRGISHDIKTPLSYIVGYSALLSNSEYSWSEKEKENYLSQIYTKGKYIESLVDDLNLTFKTDLENGFFPMNIETLNIISFLQNLIADVANNPASTNYDFSFETVYDELMINADKKLLYRSFQNLLMNAVNHNPVGTQIRLCVEKNQNEVTIIIQDTGIGMDEDSLNQIFRNYYSTKSVTDSTYSGGLGLVIVKNIIEAHHGSIKVFSTLNKGTTFTIIL